jgi:peroxiredoxin
MLKHPLAAILGGLALLTASGCGPSGSATRPTAELSQPVDAPQDDAEVRVASADAPADQPAEVAASTATAAGDAPSSTADESPGIPDTSGGTSESSTASAADTAPQAAPAALPAAVAIPVDEAPEAELSMPKVSLTEAHAALCKVKVGDAFPALPSNDLAGQTVGNPLGDKLTVVVFWNGSKPTALEQLGDLGPQVAARFGSRGLKVVAINSGDAAPLAAELAQKARAEFTLLADEGGHLLAQTTATRVPSTYLLDADGRVAWFDIEYSRTTRRELVQAIRYLLAKK